MLISKLVEKVDPTFWDRCSKMDMCDIDEEFMGFTDIYKNLARIIPKDRIVIDLGCAYAPQSVYFVKHKRYIGVDLPHDNTARVNTTNSTYFEMTIREFIEKELPKIKDEKVFAICSYVPPWHDDNEQLAKDNFKDLFVYYPR